MLTRAKIIASLIVLFDYDKAGVVRQSRRVIFKPMLGLLNQENLPPLRHMPLQIELERVNSGGDAVHVGAWNGQDNTSFNAG